MTAKKATPKKEPVGYKSHTPGSRKGKVHEAFDKHGQETAWTLGLKLKLKQATLRTWFNTWTRDKK